MPDTLTITLRTPVEYGGDTYTALDLREPTAGELAQTDGKSATEADIAIISVICAVPESVVRRVGARDFVKASRFLGGFMQPDPKTGGDA